MLSLYKVENFSSNRVVGKSGHAVEIMAVLATTRILPPTNFRVRKERRKLEAFIGVSFCAAVQWALARNLNAIIITTAMRKDMFLLNFLRASKMCASERSAKIRT